MCNFLKMGALELLAGLLSIIGKISGFLNLKPQLI